MKKLLAETADRAARYVTGIANRQVVPLPANVARLEALGGPLPQLPSDPSEVLALLDDIGRAHLAGRQVGSRQGGFLNLGVIPTNRFAVLLEDIQLPLEEIVSHAGEEIAGIGILSDKTQCLRLAGAANQNRRMGFAQRLWVGQRLGQVIASEKFDAEP